jgi:membrane protein DedA with SNARE-associated domain
MWWQYLLVLVSAFLVDVFPIPLPPAFTLMIFFQITYNLNIWETIIIGVSGSIIGRYVLTLYISKLSKRIFKLEKNEDVQFLGMKLKQKGWKGPAAIFIYSLLPLPTTPLFIASGMAKMKSIYILPAFIVGKFTSDTIAVILGEYAAKNTTGLLQGIINWKSITGLIIGLILIFALLFIDWRTLLQQRKFTIKFKIWK